MRKYSLAALLLAPLAATHAQTSAASVYFGNSLLCKSQTSGGVCDLWLNQNGTYQVFYDSGKRAIVKGVNGDFENEGRQGTYTASDSASGVKICLTPEADHPPRPRGNSPALFRDAACTVLPPHDLEALWDFTYQGENYKMGLIKGR